MSDLPPGQTRILNLFADAADEGRQPSRAEIAKVCGYAFPSAVSKHVDALVRKGLLQADPDKKRNVSLTQAGWAALDRGPAHLGVPVIGSIAAGTPILASENHETYLSDLKPSAGRFALKVRGDSMIDAGILDGDFAVIQSGQPVPDGHIGAVVVHGDATLKRVQRYKDRLELLPENPNYQPIVVPKSEWAGVQIVGPLCFVYRTVR